MSAFRRNFSRFYAKPVSKRYKGSSFVSMFSKKKASYKPKSFVKKRVIPKRPTRVIAKRRFVRSKGLVRSLRPIQNQPLHNWAYKFADRATNVGTSGAAAQQQMWCMNKSASMSVSAEAICNLHLIPPQFLVAILGLGTGPTNAGKTTKMVVQDIKVKGTMQNSGSAPIQFTEYRCRCRRDIPRSVETNMLPEWMLTNGYADVITDSGPNSVIGYTDIGATPFQNPRWVNWFKIIKVRKQVLAPGQVALRVYKRTKPRLYSNETLMAGSTAAIASAYYALQGDTFSVFAIHGTMAQDTSQEAGFVVGLSNAALVCHYEYTCRYHWVPPLAQVNTAFDYIPGFTDGTATVPLPYVNVHPDSAIVAAGSTGPGSRIFSNAGTVGLGGMDREQRVFF